MLENPFAQLWNSLKDDSERQYVVEQLSQILDAFCTLRKSGLSLYAEQRAIQAENNGVQLLCSGVLRILRNNPEIGIRELGEQLEPITQRFVEDIPSAIVGCALLLENNFSLE